MKDLEKYYGKELAYVLTELKKGKINTNVQNRKVYDPRKQMITFCSGCDIVIGGNSVDSKYIFDIGGLFTGNGSFAFGRFDSITLFNYCELSQIEEVTAAQIEAIKKTLSEFIESEQKRVNEMIEILKTL